MSEQEQSTESVAATTAAADSPAVDPGVENNTPSQQEKRVLQSIEWKYLTDSALEDWKSTHDSIVKKTIDKEISIGEVFYEIILTMNDFTSRISNDTLLSLVNTIITTIPNVKERQEASIQFLVLFQASNPKQHLNLFIQSVKIDTQFKRQYLDYSILKNGLFPDYNKCYFNDARENDYGIEVYSSLHESSEGYSKLAVETMDFFQQEDPLYKVDYYVHVIESLIGHFKLDPARSFLLLLSVFSFYIEDSEKLILEILKKSFWWKPLHANNTIQSLIASFLLNTDSRDRTPLELKTIVLLIKEGFLEFHSIYNSIKPLEFETDGNFSVKPVENKEIDDLHTSYQEELKEKAFQATASALALAAPLVMDQDDDDNELDFNKPIKMDQTATKKEVVTAKKLPVKERAQLFQKIKFLKHLLSYKMYEESLFVLAQFPFLPLIDSEVSQLINEFFHTLITPYYHELVTENTVISEIVSTPTQPQKPQSPGISNEDQFINRSCELLKFNGVRIAENPILFAEIVRIIDRNLQNGGDKDRWLQYYRRFIFPAISFVGNVAVVNEAYEILNKYYSLETRYNLYGEHQNVLIKTNSEIKHNNDIAEKKTKDILKRLSNENLGVMMRQLSKIAYSNSLAVTNTFVSHVESYSSLSELIVESSKFFGKFVWDTLTFQLCNKLNSNRLAMQDDGLNYMQWIQNLSSFIGKLSQKHLSSFQLAPILTLIIKSLNSGSTDLVLLVKEIISSMSGIQSINNLTSRQILLMNSESSLRRLVYMVIQDRRVISSASSHNLLKNLVDLDYLGELFILLSNLPDKIVENSKEPLKILNQRCDELNSLVHTFTTMIDENIDSGVFQDKMISLDRLIREFNVKPEWAFQIWRRHWSRFIKKQQVAGVEEVTVLNEVVDSMPTVLPSVDWQSINARFYVSFWQLSLYEICFKKISYPLELSEIKNQVNSLNRKISMSRREKDFSKKELKRLEMELATLSAISNDAKKDEAKHRENFELTMKRLEIEKSQWFAGIESEEAMNKSVRQMLEWCLLPRLVHSSFDSVFSSEFLFLAHSINTPGYSLLYVLNELFTTQFLETTLFTNTSSETENLGIFYFQVLKELNTWRADSKTYNRYAFGILEEEPSEGEDKMEIDQEKKLSGMKIPGSDKYLEYEDFRKALFNWHKSLHRQLQKCLESSHYTTRTNAIVFLKNLLGAFPVVEDHSEALINRLALIYSTDVREDIKLASNALFVFLSSKKSNCIHMWDFYEMEAEQKEALVKKREEKLEAERRKKEEQERQRKEQEEKQRIEQLKAAQAAAQAAPGAIKPYGLVGLQKKEKKEQKEKEEGVDAMDVDEKVKVEEPKGESKEEPKEEPKEEKKEEKKEGENKDEKKDEKKEESNEPKKEDRTILVKPSSPAKPTLSAPTSASGGTPAKPATPAQPATPAPAATPSQPAKTIPSAPSPATSTQTTSRKQTPDQDDQKTKLLARLEAEKKLMLQRQQKQKQQQQQQQQQQSKPAPVKPTTRPPTGPRKTENSGELPPLPPPPMPPSSAQRDSRDNRGGPYRGQYGGYQRDPRDRNYKGSNGGGRDSRDSLARDPRDSREGRGGYDSPGSRKQGAGNPSRPGGQGDAGSNGSNGPIGSSGSNGSNGSNGHGHGHGKDSRKRSYGSYNNHDRAKRPHY